MKSKSQQKSKADSKKLEKAKNPRASRAGNIALFSIGNIFIFYSIALHILSPGTFMDILTSFSNIWAVAGILMLALTVIRIKSGKTFRSKLAKPVKVIILVIAGTGILISVINLFFILTPQLAKSDELCDYLILLGGGIDKNGVLPYPVKERVNQAAKYLNKNPETICVVTGGTIKWKLYPEAPELKHQLVLRGVNAENVFVEDEALDTIQNLQKSLHLLSEQTGLTKDELVHKKFVIVTNHYHLARAERIARRLGFENVSGIPAKTQWFYVPMSYLREICAYIKLNLRIILTREPSKIT